MPVTLVIRAKKPDCSWSYYHHQQTTYHTHRALQYVFAQDRGNVVTSCEGLLCPRVCVPIPSHRGGASHRANSMTRTTIHLTTTARVPRSTADGGRRRATVRGVELVMVGEHSHQQLMKREQATGYQCDVLYPAPRACHHGPTSLIFMIMFWLPGVGSWAMTIPKFTTSVLQPTSQFTRLNSDTLAFIIAGLRSHWTLLNISPMMGLSCCSEFRLSESLDLYPPPDQTNTHTRAITRISLQRYHFQFAEANIWA